MDDTRPRVATIFGLEHDQEAAMSDPAVFVDFVGIALPAVRAAAIAAIGDKPFPAWASAVEPWALQVPPVPITAPGVLLSATSIGPAARPPPEALRLVVNAETWHARAKILSMVLAQQVERLEGRPPEDWAASFNAVMLQWTSAVELLELEDVASLQQAVCLLCTIHDGWNTAALQWLEHVAFTWWRRWRDAHPEVRRLLELKAAWGFESPPWLLRGADA